MSNATERTRLLTKPQYVFNTSLAQERKRRVKQFQCCLCVILVSALIIGFLASVAYILNASDGEVPNAPATNVTDALLFLLQQTWPRPDNISEEEIFKNDTEWDLAIGEGAEALKRRNEIAGKAAHLPAESPSYKHQKLFANSDRSQMLADLAYVQEYARKQFANDTGKICSRSKNCTVADDTCGTFRKYRTYDGSCNNVARWQDFGVAFTPYRRALPPDYADGISKPRVAKDGRPLPSARTVSLEVHRPHFRGDEKFSVLLAVWGQFLDHDMTATALSRGVNGSSISCCLESHNVHPECFPVKLDRFDPDLVYNVTCMEFVRSAPAPTCCLGYREQMNQVTSFIDGSVIYSVDEETVKKLRTMTGGELDMYMTEDNRTLLPISKDLSDGCNRKAENDKGRYCFLTGDTRANENLHLTSMHLIWARHHNLLARRLSSLNADWSDERVFQEVRKIVGAQMQHITYREFLPVLLGDELMRRSDLYPRTSGYFSEYNSSVDPSIENNFATAAFRFAHSIIPGLVKFLAKDTSGPEFVRLHKMLFDPFKLYRPGELDRALRSAMDTSIQASDPYFTNELKEHLFEDNSNKLCGLDLVSLNIQRGRDHGLVGYNSWREYCGLRRVSAFEQLGRDMDDESLRNIRSVYRNVDDIDLYTGALAEKPIHGSILGPTITCLILDQFVRVKIGDRFWYENPNWFTLEQLDEVRKTSLAKIICDAADDVDEIRPLVMEKVGENNEITPCEDLPAPNVDAWKESLARVDVLDDSFVVTVKD